MEIIDNGKGIHEELKTLLFHHDINDEKSHERLGLGLILIKKIIERYNGDIWIENRDPDDFSKGSKFICLIPESLQDN